MAKSKVQLTKELGDQETRIAKAQMSFVEVGDALREIRDGELYKATEYQTFDQYCEARWEMSDKHAYRLIQAATVMGHLGGFDVKPTNEAQARQLANLFREGMPPEQFEERVKELWTAVLERKQKVTAKLIGDVRSEQAKEAAALQIVEHFKDEGITLELALGLVNLSKAQQAEVLDAAGANGSLTVDSIKIARMFLTKPKQDSPALAHLMEEYERLRRADIESLRKIRRVAEIDHELVCAIPQGSTLYVLLKNGEYSLLRYDMEEDGDYDVQSMGKSAEITEMLATLGEAVKEYLPGVAPAADAEPKEEAA